ncbi:hypothetical protein FDUTEX481_09949 [Tolypothrix sp. PCC 7601]|nr:hypothetical protein FDUTEX481_09949 [Tolypothrix sp. PCC 7601]
MGKILWILECQNPYPTRKSGIFFIGNFLNPSSIIRNCLTTNYGLIMDC